MYFNKNNYSSEKISMSGHTLEYRAFENISYAENPADEKMQTLSVYVPKVYYEGKSINSYDIDNAPIFMPNTVGGYMPGPVERPGKNFKGETNATFWALLHGYVVVSPGVRGRGMKNSEGKYIGTAPAAICDLKAAVRFLRHNADKIPGDVEKIISNGTSAGGALSSLLGASGNHPDYEPYLREMGAADERDDIFAASCYCPITNLENADMAYEWEFEGLNDFHTIKFSPPKNKGEEPQMTPIDGVMSKEQQSLALELKKQFPMYLNSLNLQDDNGKPLTLSDNGDGSFMDYICSFVCKSAQKELDKGTNLSALEWLNIENGKIKSIDFKKFVTFRTRMKETPAFDNVNLGTPENELFGTPDIQYRHFTKFSLEHSNASGELAEESLIKMMNPMKYIGDNSCQTSKYYRIRHGAVDRDTSLAISAMLTAKLRNNKVNVDYHLPWGVPHSGDYDLEKLFEWIDNICK